MENLAMAYVNRILTLVPGSICFRSIRSFSEMVLGSVPGGSIKAGCKIVFSSLGMVVCQTR